MGPGNETDPDQEPISAEAVSIYRHVVRQYDRVIKVRKVGGATTLRFEKNVDGVIAVVEQVRSGAGTFSFFNMWIKKP